jgi:predicted outer membrane protein
MKTNNIWLETKERLNQINEEIAKTADPDQAMISQQISQLRIDLKNKYQELDDDSKLDWETNDQDLADLEKDFKAGTVNAINNLQMLLEKLEQKISPSNN